MPWEQIEATEMKYGTGVFGITSTIKVLLSRAQVPGGWLVLAATVAGTAEPVSITFYPDPTHAWEAAPRRED